MSRSVVRALLASAAIAAAVALAGCNADDITPTGRAMAPLSQKTLALISEKNMDKDSPILVRVFKEEAEMEVWKQTRDGKYALLKTYPICKWSGDLGPKKKQGDRQAPEGFYTITPAQMNPNSNYYLAFNTGFPNAYDRSHGYTGSELMVHGDCSSRGCYAMTDEQIQEIYALARESFFGGQKEFQFEAFPFRMTALNMAKHRNNPNFAFWKMLKEGYDDFEATRQEPMVTVCEKRYVFDSTTKDGKPLRSNPSGACPAYRLDPAVAEAVTDYRHQEQVKMASYISSGVATVAPHQGDGGTNAMFMAELTHSSGDNNGRYMVAAGEPESGARAPGALPHVPNPPGTTIPKVGIAETTPAPAPAAETAPASEPPASQAAPREEKPATLADLFGNFFKRSSQTQPAPVQVAVSPPPAQPSQSTGLRGNAESVNTEMAAKPKRAEKTRVAAGSIPLPPKPQLVAAQPTRDSVWDQQRDSVWDQPKRDSVWGQPKRDSVWDQPKRDSVWDQPKPRPKAEPRKQVAKAEPAAKPRANVAATQAPSQPAPEQRKIRTAYFGTTNDSGLLTGAQPVVPVGSFGSPR